MKSGTKPEYKGIGIGQKILFVFSNLRAAGWIPTIDSLRGFRFLSLFSRLSAFKRDKSRAGRFDCPAD